MSGNRLCDTCIYFFGISSGSCNNKYVDEENNDPYDCVFYDEVTDDYMHDMEKVNDNT